VSSGIQTDYPCSDPNPLQDTIALATNAFGGSLHRLGTIDLLSEWIGHFPVVPRSQRGQMNPPGYWREAAWIAESTAAADSLPLIRMRGSSSRGPGVAQPVAVVTAPTYPAWRTSCTTAASVAPTG